MATVLGSHAPFRSREGFFDRGDSCSVNGEYYLPPGDKDGLYDLVREVAEGYTVVGTTPTPTTTRTN